MTQARSVEEFSDSNIHILISKYRLQTRQSEGSTRNSHKQEREIKTLRKKPTVTPTSARILTEVW